MGRIRNPLYLHRYLGFESLSLRHISRTPVDQGLRGFFVSRLYYSAVLLSGAPVGALHYLWQNDVTTHVAPTPYDKSEVVG
jgi:hypothetical protein